MSDYSDDFEDYDEDFEDDEDESPTKLKQQQPPQSKSARPLSPESAPKRSLLEKFKQKGANAPQYNFTAPSSDGYGAAAIDSPTRHGDVSSTGSYAGAYSKANRSPQRNIREARVEPDALPERQRVSLTEGSKAITRGDVIVKLMQRWNDLKGKIQLGETETDFIIDMAPLTPYQAWARGHTRVNKSSTAVQCPDDESQSSQRVQTDAIKTVSQRIQVPEDIAVKSKYQMEQEVSNLSQTVATQSSSAGEEEELAKFMRKAGRVMDAMLSSSAVSRASEGQIPGLNFVKSVQQLGLPAGLKGFVGSRNARLVSSCPSSSLVAAAYTYDGSQVQLENPDVSLICGRYPASSIGVLIVWDATTPAVPISVCVCPGHPSSLSIVARGTIHVVLAGTLEGSILAWDLSEPASLHSHSEGNFCLREPSFSWAQMDGHGHVDSVVAICSIGDCNAGLSHRLVSVDALGVVIEWLLHWKKAYTDESDLDSLVQNVKDVFKESASYSSKQFTGTGSQKFGSVIRLELERLSKRGGEVIEQLPSLTTAASRSDGSVLADSPNGFVQALVQTSSTLHRYSMHWPGATAPPMDCDEPFFHHPSLTQICPHPSKPLFATGTHEGEVLLCLLEDATPTFGYQTSDSCIVKLLWLSDTHLLSLHRSGHVDLLQLTEHNTFISVSIAQLGHGVLDACASRNFVFVQSSDSDMPPRALTLSTDSL